MGEIISKKSTPPPSVNDQLRLLLNRSEAVFVRRWNSQKDSSDAVMLAREVKFRDYSRALIADAQACLLKSSQPEHQRAIFMDCQAKVDQLLFCLRNDAAAVAEAIDSGKPTMALEAMTLEKVAEVKAQLDAFCADVANYYLQDGADTYCHQMPLAIAQCMVTDDGIAIGLVDSLKKVFLPPKKSFLRYDVRPDYQKWTERQLDALVEKACSGPEMFQRIQNDIMQITAPAPDAQNIEMVMRATFDLEADEPITDRHARILALADCLLDPRQVETGTCFVERSQILVNAFRPDITFADDLCIFRYGGIIRKVDGEKKLIRATPQMADYHLEAIQYWISKDGNLAPQSADDHEKRYIWDAPGIKAALRQAGIEDSAELRQDVLKFLFETGEDRQLIFVKDVLNIYCEAWKRLNPSDTRDVKDIQYRAYFGFSALTRSPLQRLKIEMLAEASGIGGWLYDAISSCVRRALGEVAESMCKDEKENSPKLFVVQALTGVFLRTFKKLQMLSYENLGDPSTRAPGEASHGQWVLRMHDETDEGKRMDGPADFQAYMRNVSEITWRDCRASEQPRAVYYLFRECMEQIQDAVDSKDFVTRCFQLYSPDNKDKNPWTEFDQMPHTPIRDEAGGSFAGAVENLWDITTPLMEQFVADGAAQILEKVGDFVRAKRTEHPDVDPFSVPLPMVVPGHAINFTPDARLDDPLVATQCMNAGKQVAGLPMPSKMADAVRRYSFKLIQDDDSRKTARKEFTESLGEAESIHSYCKKLLVAILDNTDKAEHPALQKAICEMVLNSLPRDLDGRNLFLEITHGSVRLADLNWSNIYTGLSGKREVHSLYMNAYFDPTLGELQLGAVGDDGGCISSVDAEFAHGMWGAFEGAYKMKDLPNPVTALGVVKV